MIILLFFIFLFTSGIYLVIWDFEHAGALDPTLYDVYRRKLRHKELNKFGVLVITIGFIIWNICNFAAIVVWLVFFKIPELVKKVMIKLMYN